MIMIGAVLLVAGVAGFFVAGPKIEMLHSIGGQLAVAFGGQDAANDVFFYKVLYFGGLAAIAFGIALISAGCLKRQAAIQRSSETVDRLF